MASSTATSALAFAAIVLLASTAAADTTREAAAQALFEEGTDLFAKGDYLPACEKFRASDELDPKGGTELNLALCWEKAGRVASAWTAFSAARNRSLKEGRSERVSFADKKITELRPLLPHVRLTLVSEPPGLEIKLDDERLPRGAWTSSVPIDPGEHRIEAAAPDHRAVTVTFTATRGQETTATIPALAPITANAPPPAKVPAPAKAASASWVGWSAIGLGAAGLGVGAVFGVDALGKRSDAEELCAAGRCAEGRATNDDGVTSSWIANVAIGVGVVAVGVGAWWLLHERKPATGMTRPGVIAF